MSKKSVVLIFGVMLSLVFFTACTSGGDGGEEFLPDSNWNLTALNGSAPVAGTAITLNFNESLAVFGSDGCNNYRTTATVDGDNIQFAQPGAATLMACDEPVMSQATAYQEALAAAETFSATAEALVLMDGAGNELATFAVASQELSGTSWTVISYNNGREAVVSVLLDTEITASFGDDGQVTGTAGCNNYFASYEADAEAGTITIGQAGSTMMACAEPEGIMEQEQEYLAALATAATYSIQANTLEMRTADNALAVVMQLAP
jgi:heat shock protein HslJ